MEPSFGGTASLAQLTGLLLEARSAAVRGRCLVELVLSGGVASAAALCRRGSDGVWRRLVAAGPDDALPTLAQIEAAVAGDLPRALPPGRLVVPASDDLALGLGGADPDAEALDGVEALLLVYAAASEADAGADGLDEVQPPWRGAD
ncbi:MAG: hypothetical protein AAF682_28455 [Planctomycetota bacterium]